VTGFSDLMTLFIDLGCLYFKQTQRAFNVFKKHIKLIENRFSRLKVLLTRVGTSHKTGTPGTERLIAFSQLAVKGIKSSKLVFYI
jgi:hypothetical protein